LRARAEPTLLDASFLGMLLVLPANVRLDWKEIARYKHSSLFGLVISDEEKKFYKIDTSGLYYKTITIIIMTIVSDAPNCSVTYDRN
jgi:hypothetical protein